ncbi:hypothetical protein GIS00_17580 [Nakamurella sp. YIM 132087]|uniref:Uncharacterized protein n=1 Tax=Nakamurella alba TaxID=2665158 RepID=A0A7K1FNM9_9ACTN|nr:hypothetical protein [Nakamurella alba]MTD15748.1 hypothetical protein [Nakamurella alba]
MIAAGDEVVRSVADALAADLLSGRRDDFVARFGAELRARAGHWFDNQRALGVEAATFSTLPGGLTGDGQGKELQRTVVLGIRSPYDDRGSLPGLSYRLTVGSTDGVRRITGFAPTYVDDPMNCDCVLEVTRGDEVAVVSRRDDSTLQGWPDEVAQKAGRARDWIGERLDGTGLRAPRGTVVFLASAPYRWFSSAAAGTQVSNGTFSLAEAAGRYPGTRASPDSRIVLMLADSAGEVLHPWGAGAIYAQDVLVHEMTHQLMTRNSALTYKVGEEPLALWTIEGIAVAMEVLHRRNGTDRNDVYPLPDDLDNVDPTWIREHVAAALPDRTLLYQQDVRERNNWYALSGTVFLYLADTEGTRTMLDVARSVYSGNGRTPFAYFPDPDREGATLAPAAAEKDWREWLQQRYVH